MRKNRQVILAAAGYFVMLLSACGNQTAVVDSGQETVQETVNTVSSDSKELTREQFQTAINEFDILAKAGDLRMLDYLYFPEESVKDRENFEIMLKDERGLALWQIVYGPVVWGKVTDSDIKGIQKKGETLVDVKLPDWNHTITRLHHKLNYEQLELRNPDRIVDYYTLASEDVLMGYRLKRWKYVDGAFKLEMNAFLSDIMTGSYFAGDEFLPTDPFGSILPLHERSVDFSLVSEEMKQVMHYYSLLSEHKYSEACQYRLPYQPNIDDKYRQCIEYYDALSEEDKALVQAEFDKAPQCETYFYTDPASIRPEEAEGYLFSFKPEYSGVYEVFEEGLPVYNHASIRVCKWESMETCDHIYDNLINVLNYLYPDAGFGSVLDR